MIKTILGLMVLIAMLSSSCARETNVFEYWIFKDTTYTAISCTASGATVLGLNGGTQAGSATGNSLSIKFGSGFVPVSPGTYTVSVGDTSPTNPNQVSIILDKGYNATTSSGGTSYYATGGNGRTQTVQVVTNTTGISITGSGIMMRNYASAGDSTTLDFNVSPTK